MSRAGDKPGDALRAQVQALCDKQALLELNMRYCRAVDRCDFDLLISCYHPDAIDDHGTFRGPPVDTFPPVLARLAQLPPTQHVVTNALFELDGDVAYGEVYMDVRQAGTDACSTHGGFGRMIDRYERRGDEWRIADRRVVVEWFAPDRSVDLSRGCVGRKDRGDPSYRQQL